jgi:Cu+-exporting ATPase
MQVDTERAQFTAEHDGQRFYFCSRGCMLDFQEDPEQYLDPDWKPEGMDAHHGGMPA